MAEKMNGADVVQQLKEKVQCLSLDKVEETTVEIGRGSYGTVYEVFVDGKKCAGKKLHDILVNGVPDHPNIVKLLGVHYTDDSPLPTLVMEYLPYSLLELLPKNKHILDSYSILLDVANGLNYLHSKQPPIIHRDLSASNVLLTGDYKAKIADLGMSCIKKHKRRYLLTPAPGATCMMPPEALNLDRPVYDEKLDVFSFGCLILHTLTGQFPLPAPEPKRRNSFSKTISEWERRAEVVKMVPQDCLVIGLVPLAEQCLANDPSKRPAMNEVVEKVKVSNATILDQNFHRRNSHFLKHKYEEEYVCIERKSNSMYIHFKTEKKGKLKLKYDMKTCAGVHHRKSLDHAKNKWPRDVDPECCFIVVDHNKTKTLYLIADNQYIAQEWVKELQRHVNMNKVDKRKEEFSVNDLEKLYDILTEEGSLSWEVFGASLGLLNGTIKRIERYCSTDEDRLKECLLQWLKGGDFVHDIGGPTSENLKEALTCIGKEEIAKKVHEKFSQKDNSDAQHEGRKTWKTFGRDKQYRKVVAIAEKKDTSGAMLDLVTYKMEQNDVASVLAEICFLSTKRRSSLVTVVNKTPAKIQYHRCFIARGREASYVGFDSSVPPESRMSYSFERYSDLSIEGCAAMIFLSATTCKPEATKCFLVIAFRNYAIKLRRPNKSALMILHSSKSMDELSDLLHYARVIDNENENPSNLRGCYVGNKYPKTFVWTDCGEERTLVLPSIEFHMTMNNDNYHSHSTVTVSHPKIDTQ